MAITIPGRDHLLAARRHQTTAEIELMDSSTNYETVKSALESAQAELILFAAAVEEAIEEADENES